MECWKNGIMEKWFKIRNPPSKIRNRMLHSAFRIQEFLNSSIPDFLNPLIFPPFFLPNFFIGFLDCFAEHIDVQRLL
jgi:hypothetical protein